MDIFNDENKKLDDETQNELDDIILDKKNRNFDIKKIALLGGVAILLLVIVITIVKITSSPKNSNQDFITKETPKTEKNKNSEENYEQVPIIEEDNNIFKEEPKETIQEEKTKQPSIEEVEKKIVKQEEAPKPKVKEEASEPKIVKAKNSVTKETSKPKRKISVSKGTYYVQVGAFYKYPPSKKFLKTIKDNGFNYVIKTVIKNSSSIKKVLIGPFKSRYEAKKYLYKIKKKINKDAFITRIK